MTVKEWNDLNAQLQQIYSGILFHNQTFSDENIDVTIRYDFSCPEYARLREKYDLHMTVERFVSAETPEEEDRFIRK